METDEARQKEKRLSEQLFTKTKAALIKCNTLKKQVDFLEDSKWKTVDRGFMIKPVSKLVATAMTTTVAVSVHTPLKGKQI